MIKDWFRRVFVPKWEDWDIFLEKYITTNGTIQIKSYVTYKIQYSFIRDKFRLIVHGKGAKEHQKYTEMVAKVYALNLSNGIIKHSIPLSIDNTEDDEIVIAHFPLDIGAEKAFSFKIDDKNLEMSITNYKNINLTDHEIFEQKGNIIATDKGYYGSFYRDSMQGLPNK